MPSLEQLRHAYEHIDQRSLDRIDACGTIDPQVARNAFATRGKELAQTRQIRYGSRALGIDEPPSAIMIARRKYLRQAWVDFCADYIARRPMTVRAIASHLGVS